MNIFILDKSFQKIDVIDVYDSFIWTERYFSYGDFELVVPARIDMLTKLQKDLYLSIAESRFVMVIEDIEIITSLEKGAELKVTGRTLDTFLERRIIWGANVQVTGSLGDCVQQLIKDNVINPSDTNRKIPNFICGKGQNVPDISVSAQYTGDNLYEAIVKLCKPNHVGIACFYDSEIGIVFGIYCGFDRSYGNSEGNPVVEFSPRFDNLLNTDYIRSDKKLKNITWIQGEEPREDTKTHTTPDRVYTVYGDSNASGLDRREIFTDASSVSSTVTQDDGTEKTLTADEYTAQLQQKGKETLDANTGVTTFDGEVNANVQYTYGKDFFLGDIVSIRNEFGIEGKTRVIELVRSDDTQNGLQIYPTFKSDEETDKENTT